MNQALRPGKARTPEGKSLRNTIRPEINNQTGRPGALLSPPVSEAPDPREAPEGGQEAQTGPLGQSSRLSGKARSSGITPHNKTLQIGTENAVSLQFNTPKKP